MCLNSQQQQTHFSFPGLQINLENKISSRVIWKIIVYLEDDAAVTRVNISPLEYGQVKLH